MPAYAIAHLRTPQINGGVLEILHLRTDHIEGEAIIVPGVPDGYDPRLTASILRDRTTA